ncbi:MAG: hypothetical protein ACXWYB_10865 [Aeromicrobium sp.]
MRIRGLTSRVPSGEGNGADDARHKANMAQLEAHGVMQLWDERPTADRVESAIADHAQRVLGAHLPAVFAEHRQIRPRDAVELIYGDVLGTARSTHVRTALKKLQDAQHLDGQLTGTFEARMRTWRD